MDLATEKEDPFAIHLQGMLIPSDLYIVELGHTHNLISHIALTISCNGSRLYGLILSCGMKPVARASDPMARHDIAKAPRSLSKLLMVSEKLEWRSRDKQRI